MQLYKCNHCTRKFRDRAAHNTTYPIHAIIETRSLYNRGHTHEESARRAGRRHRLAISRQTAATWKLRYAKQFPYLKIRDAIASTYAPHTLITESRLHHTEALGGMQLHCDHCDYEQPWIKRASGTRRVAAT